MKVPLSWLKEYVEITHTPEELAHMLTMAGLEVESIDYIGRDWGDRVITAEIVHLEKVKGSDHLNYTNINTGEKVINVICGAPNIQLGDKVPLALPGAKLGDIEIGETRKFGYISQGMLCSPKEIGLGYDHSGIYILDPETAPGQLLVDILGDVVFDFAIKAHRGDLSSIIGVAREVAALTGQSLRIPQPRFQERGTPATEMIKITVEDSELCPRYTARIVSNIKIGPSPTWMGRRLLAAGMRPINNIVDITNYVMLEFGQPLHAFDYERIPEQHIIVRRACEGEMLTTLDGVERKLTPAMLLITDPTAVTAVAGVMGGARSEVHEQTTTILLESANFKAGSVRRTSTALNLRTDASTRFEKGLDPELAMAGTKRAVELIADLAGGSVHPETVDVYPQPVQPRKLAFSTDEITWLTAMEVTPQEVRDSLLPLGFAVEPNGLDKKQMLVTVPTYRSDVVEGADLVEEVVRLLGYERIPSTIPQGPLPETMTDDWFAREQEIRTLLAGSCLNEIITYTLTSRARLSHLLADPDDPALAPEPGRAQAAAERPVSDRVIYDPRMFPAIALANPLSADLEVLRLTLMGNLLETLQENSKRNRAGLRFFEIGRRYLPVKGIHQLPDERRTVAIVLSGPANTSWHAELTRSADFYDLKGVIENLLSDLKIRHYRFTTRQHPTFHPGRSAALEVAVVMDDGREVFQTAGILGEVHPLVAQRYDLSYRAYLCELDLETLYQAVPERVLYQPISRHQELTRDLALVVDQHILAQDVQDAIARSGGDLLRAVTLFDVYVGEPIPAGKKNLTYALVYQSQERTLTDTEANAIQEHIIQALHDEFEAVLR